MTCSETPMPNSCNCTCPYKEACAIAPKFLRPKLECAFTCSRNTTFNLLFLPRRSTKKSPLIAEGGGIQIQYGSSVQELCWKRRHQRGLCRSTFYIIYRQSRTQSTCNLVCIALANPVPFRRGTGEVLPSAVAQQKVGMTCKCSMECPTICCK